MTNIINKRDKRDHILQMLIDWHANLGILSFPKRYGISTNEKKFREISFRSKSSSNSQVPDITDIIVAKQPIYGLNHSIVGYNVTYRVWIPTTEGKIPATTTIRFSLHKSIVGLVRVDDYIIAVKHDNFPLQNKTTDLPRMHGVTDSEDLTALAKLLLKKEFPFFEGSLKSLEVSQLGDTIFQDPSTRKEETLSILIDIKLQTPVSSKEDLETVLDPRNKELLLYKAYTDKEVEDMLKTYLQPKQTEKYVENKTMIFRDPYSIVALLSYFNNN